MSVIRWIMDIIYEAMRWVTGKFIPKMRGGKRDKTPLPVMNLQVEIEP
jgi:hypothetical protein